MTTTTHAWLPPIAIFDGGVSRRFDELLQTWRRQWFPAPITLTSKATAAPISGIHRGEHWRTQCGNLAFAADQQRRIRLASAVLGFNKTWRKSDSRDAAFLSRLAQEAVADFAAGLASLFQNKPSLEKIEGTTDSLPIAMSFGVSNGAGKLFDISVSWEAAVAARKSLTPPARATLPLQSRHAAIASQQIRIGGYVGSGRVELSDLRALAPGDILVLDRAIGDEFNVTINGRTAAQADYEIKRDGAGLVLQFKGKVQNGGGV